MLNNQKKRIASLKIYAQRYNYYSLRIIIISLQLADMKKESQIKDNENVQITQLQKHLSETQDEKIELNDSLQTMKEQLEHHVSESKKKERLIEDLRSEVTDNIILKVAMIIFPSLVSTC